MRSFAASVLALSLLLPACGDGTASDRGVVRATGVGMAEVAIPLEISEITAVLVTVSGPGIAAPIAAPLAIVGDLATGLIAGIPAGTDRTFSVQAYVDAVLVCTGVAIVEIVADTRAAVDVILDCSVPPDAAGEAEVVAGFNFPPEIMSLTATPSSVLVNGTVALEVVATDPDGDPLTYNWTATGGTIDSPTSSTPIWTAPAIDGTYGITVEVLDGTTSVSLSIEIVVSLF